jgi:Leucine-rich repeat (LRR) protein
MPKGGYFLSSASLRVLRLSNCNLHYIPPQTFQELPNLQELCVSHKVIEILYPVKGVERLTVLDLCHNYLRNLDSGVFSAIPKPVSPNLSYKRLSTLNATVMPQLVEVSSANELNGNPWVCDVVMFNTVYF